MIALKLWYDGSNFFGFQKQPDLRTVESELLGALETIGADLKSYRAAGRTDKGVSALSMVVCFEYDGEFKIGELNSYLPYDIRTWAYTPVPFKFKPRYPKERSYRYVALKFKNQDTVRAACKILEGGILFIISQKRISQRRELL